MSRKLIPFFMLISLTILNAQADSTSVRSVKFQFQPVISGVENVFVGGTFNGWKPDQHRMLDEDGDGKYEISLLLPEGLYLYKFIVDGQFLTDPEAADYEPDGQGGQNAVLVVDASFAGVRFEAGDGSIYTSDLELHHDYGQINPVEDGIIFTCRVHRSDVASVSVVLQNRTDKCRIEMGLAGSDERLDYFQARVDWEPHYYFAYYFVLQDGDETKYGTARGWIDDEPNSDNTFHYQPKELPIYKTPDWAKRGVFYQIFPERFRNGDPSNDPDFSESFYEGLTDLPESGKTDDAYFHLVEDWNDVAGLTHSPYRTDGAPDLWSFYGGDIQGVTDKLDYLHDLGVTIIYFNPLNPGKSNHKYDPIDYLQIDPHFADDETFKAFVQQSHELGIRIIVDMAFNHTGDGHFAFVDTRDKGPDSEYWDWYEWHTWPLPPEGCRRPCNHYSCWWGYPLHPNLNFDHSRTDADENMIRDIADADPNMDVVNYCLQVAHYWIGELGCDGFRLDVPNEVPLWFWNLFRATVDSLKPDAFLIGEIWHNAMPWLGPDCFHATMNYKYFRDPVLNFFIHQRIDAQRFDQQLFPGRYTYPLEATQVMMNLVGSHDTERTLTLAGGDVRRMKLAALFQMTYVGIPQIYYGDEVGLEGGRDPDNRRTFPWDWEADASRRDIHAWYRKLIQIRHANPELSVGTFKTVLAENEQFAYLRELDGEQCLVCINNSASDTEINIPDCHDTYKDLAGGTAYPAKDSVLKISLEAMSGVILKRIDE